MNVTNAKALALLLGCLVLAGVMGCSDGAIDTEAVTGVVTLDGAPIEGVTVSFSPVEKGKGDAGFGTTDASGKYLLQTLQGKADAGTTPGEYMVTLSKVEMVGTGKMLPTPEGGETEEMEGVERLPKKYTKKETSGFTATVTAGGNTFDFDLKSE